MKKNTTSRFKVFCGLASILALAAAMLAQGDGQKAYAGSQEAVDALIAALRQHDKAELKAILGPDTDEIVSSGDDVMDRTARESFLSKYDVKHSLVPSAKNELTLNVGRDDWPLPIPLVKGKSGWYFDGAAGKDEILYRRIGHNELAAINVCRGIVSAQHDYAQNGHDGNPAGAYAARVVSEPGKQNGLYWRVSDGETPSPAGPLIAQAAEEGYTGGAAKGQPTPYHGYLYRMITGAKGFQFVAYPADYRSSGVMTFVVGQDGVVYQKDLGEQTSDIVKNMTDVKRDSTWKRV